MYRYRGYVLGFVLCFLVQIATFRVLDDLGAREFLIWTVETAGICVTVWITMSIGERFERK
jgi:hypothetical protein